MKWPRLRWSGCLGRVILFVIIVAAGVGGLWLWLRAAPSWYQPPPPDDPSVARFAEEVEVRVVQELQLIRPAGPDRPDTWTLRVRDGQVNAWLATRLPQWLAHDDRRLEWPESLGRPQLHCGREGIDLGVEIRTGALSGRVVVVRVMPTIVGGRLHLSLDRIGVGRAAVSGTPLDRLLELTEDVLPEGLVDEAMRDQVAALFGGTESVEPIIPLADGREVEVVGLRLDDGYVDITSRTR